MEGFFNKSETQDLINTKGRSLSCFSCGLARGTITPKMKPYGKFKKNIMIIGEAPGEYEDRKGKPWQGKAGQFLKCTLAKYGINLFEDCVSLNAVNCRPPDNTTPQAHEINCCREIKVSKAIAKYNPDIIILLGSVALNSLIGHRWQKSLGSISKWRGWKIPDRDFKAWICPTFHPSYVARAERREVTTVWEQDLKSIVELINVPRPKWKKPRIHYIDNLEPLRNIKSGLTAFDYEATGIKHHADGQRIVCAAVAYDENNAYAFEMPKRKKHRIPFLEYLENASIDKIAANIKYEDHWSIGRLGVQVIGWAFDTMQAAHVLDNRPGISGLKFQAYVRLGIVDYDSDVAPYLQAKEKGGNALNQIYKLLEKPDGMKMLLKYCGWDAICELRLANLQIEELDYDWLPF